MARYYKKFILFVIPLFLIFISYNVDALSFSSTSVRIASWFENGTLADSGFVSTNSIPLPQYVSSSIGAVSLRLFQWRYTTSSNLSVGRYKITTDITFSNLDGNNIDNFLSINKFEEYGAGTAYNNSVASNMDLISYDISKISDTSLRFEYVFDLKSASYNFFSGIIKWGNNEFTSKYAINQYGTVNEKLSYFISYSSIEILNNQDIIDNQDKNTQDIIDNQDKNTQDIIDNQDKNNEELKETIEDQFVDCTFKSIQPTIDESTTGYLSLQDTYVNSNFYKVSNYISISSNTNYTISIKSNYNSLTSTAYCLYDINRVKISCSTYKGSSSISFNSGDAVYFRTSIRIDENYFTKILLEGNICVNRFDDTNDKLDGINGALTDDNVDSDVGTGFFDDFDNEDFGLSEIITIPLNTITSLTSKTCQPLSIPIPKTGKNVSLPCMTQVYQENIPSIFSIWQIVSFGIIAYFVAVDIFHLVKGFKDPESDKVEVLDL